MTTHNNTTIDPTLGVPMAGPVKARANGKTPPAAAPTNVIAYPRRKSRLSGDEYRRVRDFASTMTGYDSTSPIWGKQVPEILDMIDAAIDAKDYSQVKTLTQEFRKRIARGQLIKAQR